MKEKNRSRESPAPVSSVCCQIVFEFCSALLHLFSSKFRVHIQSYLDVIMSHEFLDRFDVDISLTEIVAVGVPQTVTGKMRQHHKPFFIRFRIGLGDDAVT